MPTRLRNSRARCVAALVMLCALLMPAVAWAQPVGVVAEGTVDGRARLIVDGTGPIAVTVDGQPQPSTTVPLLSDRLATALVVDASAAGGPSLQPGLSGLVDFGLAAPPTARTALVADTTPPAVVSPLQPGAAGVLSGLSTITPRADRQTAAALDLAAAQLPPEPGSPRLVVLYTTSDGTAESPTDLAARLRADGVVLAVVTTAADQYWAAVAAGTGGVAVGARPTGVLDAFGQVESALRTRSLVTLPAPPRTATPAVVHLGPRSVTTEIPASAGPLDPTIILAAVVAGIVAVALAAVAVVRLIRSRRPMARRRASRVWNVPDLAMPTVVRRRVQSALDHALALGGPVVVRGADGRPGMGVTTAMLQFAHHYRDTYEVAWWIAAQDPQLIADQMAQLAEALGVAAPTDSAEQATSAALAALRRRKRWLVLFDDAGNGRDLARFLPGGTGHVLVGSADPDWEARVVTVPPFTRAESVGLLRTRREGITAAEAEHVAKALGDVPLDVDAAGAMLAATGTSVASYVDAVVAARSAATAAPGPHGTDGAAKPGLNGTARSDRKAAVDTAAGSRRAASTEPKAQSPTSAAPGGQGTGVGPNGTPRAVDADRPNAPAKSDPKAGGQTATAGPHDAKMGSSRATGASPNPDAGASPTVGPGSNPDREPHAGADTPSPSNGATPPGSPAKRDATAARDQTPRPDQVARDPKAGPEIESGPRGDAPTGGATSSPHMAAAPNGAVLPNEAAAPEPKAGPSPAAPPNEAAEAAWTVAFDRLAAEDPPALALLTLLAWLGHEPVPQDLLVEHREHLPPSLRGHDLSELTATLTRRGLAHVERESLQQHRLPAAHLVRRTADERPDGASWATWAVRLVRSAVPPSPDDPAGWPAWRRLMPLVLTVTDPTRPLDDVAVEVGWLLRRAAGFLQARGSSESARALLEDAHDLYRRKLGRDHPETRTAARALADNLHALGRTEQARRVLEDAQVNGASAS